MSDQVEAPESQGDPEALGDAGKKALQAERSARESAEKRLREVEAALESVTGERDAAKESFEDQMTALRAEVARTAVERDRVQVAYEKGLPVDLVEYLRGETREEMEKSAETLATHLMEARKPGVPKPDMSQGAHGEPGPVTTNQMFADFAEHLLRN